MFKYISSPSHFSGNPTKRPSSIPCTFTVSFSGRQLYRSLAWLKLETTQEFWKFKPIYLSIYSGGKKSISNDPYSSKINLCSVKAKKLVPKVFKICKPKFYYQISKDKILNPQQTNAAQPGLFLLVCRMYQ